MPEPVVSVVIANWEGEQWIERALSSVQHALRQFRRPGEIIVVDDASEGPAPARVSQNFPNVRLIRNPRNLGFAATVNRGVRAARAPFVVLLNNDLVCREEFFSRLLAPFDEPGGERVIAVSARTMSWDGTRGDHLCMAGRFVQGRVAAAWKSAPARTSCVFALGGAMVVRREEFLRFGGFDSIYAPGYWEDYDFCWKAVRAGWEILYEPAALAFHVGGGSMVRRFGQREVFLTRQRNRFLFEWLNLRDTPYLRRHLLALPKLLLKEWLRGEGFAQSQALVRALRKLKPVLQRRRAAMGDPGPLAPGAVLPLTDAELFAKGRGYRVEEP